jgi:hypothetical protein
VQFFAIEALYARFSCCRMRRHTVQLLFPVVVFLFAHFQQYSIGSSIVSCLFPSNEVHY